MALALSLVLLWLGTVSLALLAAPVPAGAAAGAVGHREDTLASLLLLQCHHWGEDRGHTHKCSNP